MTFGVQIEINQNDDPSNRKIWILFFVLALLFHLLIFRIQFDLAPNTATVPPKVEIQQVDPRKLDAIKNQWKQRRLLLDKNPSQSKDKNAPKDARYMSDRNIRVEKEQRARDTQVMPAPGRMDGSDSGQESRPRQEREKQERQEKAKPGTHQKYSDLSRLALPFQLDGRQRNSTPAHEREEFQPASSGPRGGDQAIDDKSLPEGSENLLNAQESIYYSFYARLYEAIGPLWQSKTKDVLQHNPVRPGEYVTLVDVVLDQNGNLKEIRRLQSSGVEAFDNTVEETWRKVQRFPNPPQGLLDKEREVHIGWKFTIEVGPGNGMNYLPPQRSALGP